MTTSYTFTQVEAKPETPVTGRSNLYAKTDGRLYVQNSDGIEVGLALARPDSFSSAVDLEDHSTQDMPLTTVGARTMQDPEQPSIEFRRFDQGVARGVGRKLWVPRQSKGISIKFASRSAAASSGNLHLYINFRTFPDLNWHGFPLNVAQAANTPWGWWSLSFSLDTLGLSADSFQQMSLVRKGDAVADTLASQWDLAALVLEAL